MNNKLKVISLCSSTNESAFIKNVRTRSYGQLGVWSQHKCAVRFPELVLELPGRNAYLGKPRSKPF